MWSGVLAGHMTDHRLSAVATLGATTALLLFGFLLDVAFVSVAHVLVAQILAGEIIALGRTTIRVTVCFALHGIPLKPE